MDEWVDGVLQNAQSKQARALAWLRTASSALSVGRVVSSGHHQHHQHHHQHHCTWLLCQRVITIIASASSPASPSPPSSSRASFAQTLVASAVRLLLIFFSVRTFLGSGAGGPAGWCLTHIQTRPRGSLGAAICETVCETVAICASMPLCPDHRPGACPSAPVPPSPSVRSPLGPRRYLSFFRPFWPSWQRSARRQKST